MQWPGSRRPVAHGEASFTESLTHCGTEGQGRGAQSCWPFLQQQIPHSQGPWKSIHLERLVSGFTFLSWGQAP